MSYSSPAIDPRERSLVIFAILSWQAYLKKQIADADRLLILAGEQACMAGTLQVTDTVKKVLLSHAPHHMLANYASFADAMRASDFQEYLKGVHRFCSVEQAEWLLTEMNLDWENKALKDGNYWEYADYLIKEMLQS
jgi:hypothetical protein